MTSFSHTQETTKNPSAKQNSYINQIRGHKILPVAFFGVMNERKGFFFSQKQKQKNIIKCVISFEIYETTEQNKDLLTNPTNDTNM